MNEREWVVEREEKLFPGFFFQQFTILGPVVRESVTDLSSVTPSFLSPAFFLFVFNAIASLSTGTVKIAGIAISIPRENGFLDVVVSRLTIPIVPLECDMDRLICRDVCRRGEIYLFASKWWKIRKLCKNCPCLKFILNEKYEDRIRKPSIRVFNPF